VILTLIWLLMHLGPAQAAAPVRVRLAIQPTGVRLRVTDSAGRYFAPAGHLATPDMRQRSTRDLILGDGEAVPLTLYALVYDGAEIELAPGRYTFAATKGYEYEPVRREVEITDAPAQTVTLALRKFADFEAKGWYSGDPHVHWPDPKSVRYQMECEGLRVVNMVLGRSRTNGWQQTKSMYWYPQLFTGEPDNASDRDHFIQIGEELGHPLLAHMGLMKLKSIVWPPQPDGSDYDAKLSLYADDEAHAQGGLVTWFHWPYPSMEAPLDIALGRVDAIDLLTTGSPFAHDPVLVDKYEMHGPKVYSIPPIDVYYHYLNCGFHLAMSSGSDKPGMNPPMGSARVFVKPDGPLSYSSWVEGIRKGRTFASDYPLLEFAVNGRDPGDTIRLAPGKAKLRVKARAVSIEPYEVLEIVYNGKVIRSEKAAGAHFEAAIDESIEVDRGGWIAARAHGPKMLAYGHSWWAMPVMAHSSPVYLDMPGRHAPAAEGARLFLEQLGYLEQWIGKQEMPEADRRKAAELIERARTIYRGLAARE
jgi:hypothetical protein